MNWLARLLRRRPVLSIANGRALEEYGTLPEPDLRQPLQALRCVIVDVETSGLNPFRDSLISIGAVALVGGLLRFAESFEIVLRQETPSADHNILVHGIDGTTQTAGKDAADGLAAFLRFAGKSPLIGFHADFDRVMIGRAARTALGIEPANSWLDVAMLAPALFANRAPGAATLDDWLQVFGIVNYSRHNAVADACATAQLFQIVAAQAARQGMRNCADLMRLEKDRRWLELH
ncbi:MAG: 3'-5' exonuclease [Pseudomonadota bacterium]